MTLLSSTPNAQHRTISNFGNKKWLYYGKNQCYRKCEEQKQINSRYEADVLS